MINDALSSRMQAYIPEVLMVTDGETRGAMLDFINSSVVSIDFGYISSPESSEEVISKVLSQSILTVTRNFVENIVRFGRMCDTDYNILKMYFPVELIDLFMSNRTYYYIIALAYLNAAHASLIAAPITNQPEQRNNGTTNANG